MLAQSVVADAVRADAVVVAVTVVVASVDVDNESSSIAEYDNRLAFVMTVIAELSVEGNSGGLSAKLRPTRCFRAIYKL